MPPVLGGGPRRRGPVHGRVRSAAAAHEPSPEEALSRQLYPDQATFRREEQRRFEILLAHWDLPLVSVDLTE